MNASLATPVLYVQVTITTESGCANHVATPYQGPSAIDASALVECQSGNLCMNVQVTITRQSGCANHLAAPYQGPPASNSDGPAIDASRPVQIQPASAPSSDFLSDIVNFIAGGDSYSGDVRTTIADATGAVSSAADTAGNEVGSAADRAGGFLSDAANAVADFLSG